MERKATSRRWSLEWPLDPGVKAINQGGRRSWYMLRDGTTERVWMDESDFEYTLDDQPHIWRRSEAPAYQGKTSLIVWRRGYSRRTRSTRSRLSMNTARG